MSATPTPITWLETEPGIWRSLDGRYAIVAVTLPENPPKTEYLARKIDPAMAAAYPTRHTLGYPLECGTPWLWNTDNSVHSAQAIVERDAWVDAHPQIRSVPNSYPAAALVDFYWPISKGTSRGALAIVRDGDRVLARVVGTGRRDGDDIEVGTFAEIDINAALEATDA